MFFWGGEELNHKGVKKSLRYKIKYNELSYGFGDQKWDLCQKVQMVLDDPRGWTQFGYKFTKYSGNVLDKDVDFIISIERDEFIKNTCGFDGFSCTDHGNKKLKYIYFNLNNWTKAPAPAKYNDIESYRNYVINHEVAHVLDLHHLDPKNYIGKPCPIRVSQTKDVGETIQNCWVLPFEDSAEDEID